MNLVDQVIATVFGDGRAPRSPEFMAGVRAALEARLEGKSIVAPYPLGSTAADAFYGGLEEGHWIWRKGWLIAPILKGVKPLLKDPRGRRSVIDRLPIEVRSRIRNRLYETDFRSYVLLAEELAAEGIKISKTSLHRYGQQLKLELEQLEAASRALSLNTHLGAIKQRSGGAGHDC